jgi:hypothetical protein
MRSEGVVEGKSSQPDGEGDGDVEGDGDETRQTAEEWSPWNGTGNSMPWRRGLSVPLARRKGQQSMPLRSDAKKAPAFFFFNPVETKRKARKKGSFRTGVGRLDWTAFR